MPALVDRSLPFSVDSVAGVLVPCSPLAPRCFGAVVTGVDDQCVFGQMGLVQEMDNLLGEVRETIDPAISPWGFSQLLYHPDLGIVPPKQPLRTAVSDIDDLDKEMEAPIPLNQIFYGPPGTGKSQTLTAIITNALENRQKILVVCEKRTALEVLHENLKAKGLESLTILIKDSKTDRC